MNGKHRTPRSAWRLAAAGLMVMTATGCLDLAVENQNEPDRDRALSDALAIESLIAGSFATWWDVKQGRTSRYYSAMASSHTNTALNYGIWDAAFEPRKAVINMPGYQWGYPYEDPFMLLNRALAAIRDGLVVMDEGLEIGVADVDGPRLRAMAKLLQGLIHGHIAKIYDQGWIVDEDTDTQASVAAKDLKPYTEVMAAARGYLAEARQIASTNTFATPATWMASSFTNQQFVRITHSYEARFMAAVARTPAERQAVNWNEVLTHIAAGVTSDFGIQIDGPGGRWSSDLKNMSGQGGGVHLRLLGPADQSGRWQAWEAKEPRERTWFYVETDDARIHAPGSQGVSGTRFQLRYNAQGQPTVIADAQRGLWYQTPYSTFAWRTIAENSLGFAPDLTVEEMDFLRAEAYIRLNRAAEALPIINKTRVENGRLPPVTLDGDQSARCVPRTITGACGDLWDALIYEKFIEVLWVSAGLDYTDARGNPRLNKVPKGTPIHMPVPALELNALPMAVYTFGGSDGGATP